MPSLLRQIVREQQEMLWYIMYCHLHAAVMSVDFYQNNFDVINKFHKIWVTQTKYLICSQIENKTGLDG